MRYGSGKSLHPILVIVALDACWHFALVRGLRGPLDECVDHEISLHFSMQCLSCSGLTQIESKPFSIAE